MGSLMAGRLGADCTPSSGSGSGFPFDQPRRRRGLSDSSSLGRDGGLSILVVEATSSSAERTPAFSGAAGPLPAAGGKDSAESGEADESFGVFLRSTGISGSSACVG